MTHSSGYTLAETVVALFASMLILSGSVTAGFMAMQQERALFIRASAEDSAGLLAIALARDVSMASGFQYTGSHLYVTEDDGSVNGYWLDPVSDDVLRSVDGSGAVVESTDVHTISFAVTPSGGLHVEVFYESGQTSEEQDLWCAFAEGGPR